MILWCYGERPAEGVYWDDSEQDGCTVIMYFKLKTLIQSVNEVSSDWRTSRP